MAVVAVKLDPAEVLGVKVNLSHGGEPAEQVMHVGAGVSIEFLYVVQPLERGFEDPVPGVRRRSHPGLFS